MNDESYKKKLDRYRKVIGFLCDELEKVQKENFELKKMIIKSNKILFKR